MLADLLHACRRLRRRKLFAGLVVLLLATGICANVLVFSFVDTLLLRPLPVRAPAQLFLLQKMRVRQVRPDPAFDYRQFQALRNSGWHVAAVQDWSRLNFQPLETEGSVRLVTAQMVSPDFFAELGVKAALGRVLMAGDVSSPGPIPAVLSFQFWQEAYGGSAAAIGRQVRIRHFPFVIVGVLPREFHGLDIERAPDFRVPVSAATALLGHSLSDARDPQADFQIVARLTGGVAPDPAAARLTALLQPGEETIQRERYTHLPDPMPAWAMEEFIRTQSQYQIALRSMRYGVSSLRDDFSGALVLLLGGVALLLAAVCASVAGLVIAEGEERKHEIAVRLAMGAGRGRIVRQLLAEHALLAVAAGALGSLAAFVCFPLAARLLPVARISVRYITPRILDASLDARSLFFALALSAASVLLFGLMPAWRAARAGLHRELRSGGRAVTGTISGFGPVAVQVALSVVMLAASVLLIRTFRNLDRLNPGFDRRHVLSLTIDPSDATDSPAAAGLLARKLREQVQLLPGVRDVSYTDMALMRGLGMMMTVAPHGVVLPKSTFLNTTRAAVTPGYFATLGIALQSGRNLDWSDAGRRPESIVVNRAFADAFFPHQNPVGKTIVYGTDGNHPADAVIVGVAATAKYRTLREHDPPTHYRLFDESKDVDGPLSMYIRADADAASLLGEVRRTLRRVDANVPIMEASTMEQEVENTMWRERLLALFAGFFGAVCLMLTAMGLYGSLARFVAARRREFGIRVALGARRPHLVGAVATRMVGSVAAGLAAGLVLAVWLARFTRQLLFGVTPWDAASFVLAIAMVVLSAALAVVRPAARAARTHPADALREE